MHPRLGALAGFAFLVLSFATFALAPQPPAPDAPVADLVAWYVGDPEGIRAIAAVFAIAIVALVVWVAAARDLIWADGGSAGLAGATSVGTAIVSVSWMAAAGMSSAVAMRVDDLGPDVVVFAGVFAGVLSAVGQVGLAVTMAASSLAAVATGRWSRATVVIGWIGAALALVSALGVAIDDEGFMAIVGVSWLATTAWIVAGSVDLLRATTAEPTRELDAQKASPTAG